MLLTWQEYTSGGRPQGGSIPEYGATFTVKLGAPM